MCRWLAHTSVFSSLRVLRGSGSRNWPLGFAVTSHGLWIKSRAGRRKTRASIPSFWYSWHRVKRAQCNLIIMLCRYWCKCVFKFQEAESKPQCRRLQLKDIIPIEMQRLTKYPLLLENIAKNTGRFFDHVKANWECVNGYMNKNNNIFALKQCHPMQAHCCHMIVSRYFVILNLVLFCFFPWVVAEAMRFCTILTLMCKSKVPNPLSLKQYFQAAASKYNSAWGWISGSVCINNLELTRDNAEY